MRRVRRWWWLVPVAFPVIVYAGLIVAAYIKPPLNIPGLSTGYDQIPVAVVEVENHSRWPVTLQSVSVQGVLPPDEVGAFATVGMESAQVYSLSHPEDIATVGALKGWVISPAVPNARHGVNNGVKLVWYQSVDLRWMRCPTVRYRYLGWPLAVRFVCDENEGLRGAAITGGMPPGGLGEWGQWEHDGSGIRFRTQRLKQGQNEDLWIEVESEQGIDLTLNRFTEEPGGGHARLHMRFISDPSRPGATTHFTVPLRWDEPTPEIRTEVIPFSQLHQ